MQPDMHQIKRSMLYGVKNFTALFAATGLFEVVKMENGQAFVADRRNGDRAPKPVR